MQSSFRDKKPTITVTDFIAEAPPELALELLAGAQNASTRKISSPRIQKLGLALAGFADYIKAGRVQIVGQSEISYFAQLKTEKKLEAVRHLDLEKICCVLITGNLKPPAELTAAADSIGLPILRTPKPSSATTGIVSNFLEETLAPQKTIHGVLVGMFGIGVLILGESGIGKSECALDLITRGHNLIADDAIEIKKIGSRLQGTSPELVREHLEIRGLGIVNIRDLFGASAIGKEKKQIDVCIELKKWTDGGEIERLGLDAAEEDIFGAKIPKFVLPVGSGRNISTLVETAIRVHLLRIKGIDAARKLIEKHTLQLSARSPASQQETDVR